MNFFAIYQKQEMTLKKTQQNTLADCIKATVQRLNWSWRKHKTIMKIDISTIQQSHYLKKKSPFLLNFWKSNQLLIFHVSESRDWSLQLFRPNTLGATTLCYSCITCIDHSYYSAQSMVHHVAVLSQLDDRPSNI